MGIRMGFGLKLTLRAALLLFMSPVAAADQVKRELIEICCADIDNKQCEAGRGGAKEGETDCSWDWCAVDRLLA